MDSESSLNPNDRWPPRRLGVFLFAERTAVVLCLCVFCLCLFSVCALVHGQVPLPSSGNPEENSIPAGLRPDVVFLKNEQGEQILVPRVRYEEFEKYLQSSAEMAAENGNVALSASQFDVQIEGKNAKIRAELSCVVNSSTSKWTLVPIGLGNIQFIPGESNSASRVGIASNGNGYVWRLPPSQAGTQKLSIAAASKIGVNNQVESLRLELPSTSSSIILSLPKGDWDVSVSGSGSEVVEPLLREGNPQYRILTSGGSIEIQWVRNASFDTTLGTEVSSQSRFVSSKLGLFSINSRLNFRGPKRLGGRRFLIELPVGSVWKASANESRLYSGYRLSLTEGTTENPVRLALDIEESMSRNELEVSFDWNWEPKSDDDHYFFPMPFTEGVQKHSGTVEIVTLRSQSLIWDAQPEIEFLRRGTSSDSPDSVSNVFRVTNQERQLKCGLLRQKSNLSIRADYQLDLLVDRVQAIGVLDFQEDLRLLPFLQWETRGWKVDRMFLIPSGKDLNLSTLRSNDESRSIVPLSINDLIEVVEGGVTPSVPADSTTGRRIGVQMTRKFDANVTNPPSMAASTVELFMPSISWLDDESQVRKSWVPSGELLIRSSFASLQPREKDWIGVDVESIPSVRAPLAIEREVNRISSGSSALSRYQSLWNLRGQEDELKLSFDLQPLLTDIECSGTSRLFIEDRNNTRDQDWLLQFQGLAPAELFLAIPNDWLPATSTSDARLPKDILLQHLELTINGVEVQEWQEVEAAVAEKLVLRHPKATKDCRWVQFSVPHSLLTVTTNERTWLLTLRPTKKQTLQSLATDRINPVFATLDSDATTSLLRQDSTTCLVHTVPGTKLILESFALGKSSSIIQIGDKRWYQTKIVVPSDSPKLRLIVTNASSTDNSSFVHGVWLQSVIKPKEIRHRFVTRFQSNQSSITIDLPPALNANPKCILNGLSTVLSPLDSGRFVVDLSSAPALEESPDSGSHGAESGERPRREGEDRFYVLEVFSWPTMDSAWWTKTIAMPTISIDGSDMRRSSLVWQVVSSRSDHLLATSELLSPSYRWKWSSLWMVRDDKWNQEMLEKQFGASSQPVIESQVNRYTLVTLDGQNAQWIFMVPRIMIWVPAALVALAAFFLMCEFHWLRNKYLWVVGLLVLVTSSQWAFDSTLLFSQALLGASAVSMTFFLVRWTFDRNTRRKSVFSGRPSQMGNATANRPDSRVELPAGNANNNLATTISPAGSIIPSALEPLRTEEANGQ